MGSFEAHLKALDIRSPIQKKAVEILSGLQGYSKRLDLLHDQLRKELAREGVGPSRINPQLSELIELRLANEKTGTEGIRLSLNKDIWELDPKVIKFVWQVTEYFANKMRSDAQFSGILRAVKTKIRESKKLPVELGYSVFEILVTCALRRHHDWEIVDGQVSRKSALQSPNGDSEQQEFPVSDVCSSKTPQKAEVRLEPMGFPLRASSCSSPIAGTDLVSLPKNIEFDPATIEAVLPAGIVAELGSHSVRFFDAVAVIEVPLSLGREQRIYITLRRNTTHEKVFWLFSVCGPLDDVHGSINDIVWHNNECSAFKVTFLDMPTGMHVGVCYTLLTDNGWERQIPSVVRNLAAFGDRLEELYWSQDEF